MNSNDNQTSFVHPASKDYGNDAMDAIAAQPAIQQMIDDYDEVIAQLEAQINDLQIERAQLKHTGSFARTEPSASTQLEELAIVIVVNAWNHATELSVLQGKILDVVGVARRAAPPNALETEADPLELAGRLMAIVTDAWLHARDRTLPQLHNEALAVLKLAQRQ